MSSNPIDENKIAILLAEDDPASRQILLHGLLKAGFNVEVADNGREALEKLSGVKIDLILSDIEMPLLDGYGLYESVKANQLYSDIPFIFLTMKTTPEDQVRGLGLGVDEYVTKPVNMKVLVARIKLVLDRKKSMEKVSLSDSLTGLLNREVFKKLMKKELAKIQREEGVGCLAFMDIDNFKSVNDTYGHLEGDRILVALAQFLTESTREMDLKGRFGGEEFLIFLPGADIDAAYDVTSRILNDFKNKKVGENGLTITFSAGLVEAPGDGLDFDILCERADMAMYTAKKMGKSRVIRWKEYCSDNETESNPPQEKAKEKSQKMESHDFGENNGYTE